MKFVDSIKIKVKAGNGGNGALSFFQDWHQKVPRADGGNGGNGADIIFISSFSINTFSIFKSNQLIRGKNGENGNKSKKSGKNADPLIIKVPVGTVIFSDDKKNIYFDFDKENEKFTIVNGGKGGRGNAFFISNKNKYGKKFENGTLGEYREIVLELKTIADIGLIGLPNAGKSSLLKSITNAKPQIANYEFTTLSPNLGILKKDKKILKIADLPGIIKGASIGTGLGNKFLRHIERCKLILHIIDLNVESYEKFYSNYKIINDELLRYDLNFSKIPTLIIGTKIDIENSKIIDSKIKNNNNNIFNSKNYFVVSSINFKNINELILKLFKFYDENKKNKTIFEKNIQKKYKNSFLIKHLPHSEIRLKKMNKGMWEISGQLFDNLLKKYDIFSDDGLEKINMFLEKKEIRNCLQVEGIKNNDIIVLAGKNFIWKY